MDSLTYTTRVPVDSTPPVIFPPPLDFPPPHRLDFPPLRILGSWGPSRFDFPPGVESTGTPVGLWKKSGPKMGTDVPKWTKWTKKGPEMSKKAFERHCRFYCKTNGK